MYFFIRVVLFLLKGTIRSSALICPSYSLVLCIPIKIADLDFLACTGTCKYENPVNARNDQHHVEKIRISTLF